MPNSQGVLEYKCPCCGAGLAFGESTQKMSCEYCGNDFEMEAVQTYNASLIEPDSPEVEWSDQDASGWSEEEQAHMQVFVCPSCGGELITDENTAATFCPYCENPAILQKRLSGGIRPDYVIPFKTSKEDAENAFLSLCKGKKLLPKMFTKKQRIEKITGIYVPFWLYDCTANYKGNFSGTHVQTWSDAQYIYTKTDHYLLAREASANFVMIPVDGSSKMDDTIMESIEPFDFSTLVPFSPAYLSGFYADKYDVESQQGLPRVQERVDTTMSSLVSSSLAGFTAVTPSNSFVQLADTTAKYVLLPVWMLNTNYEGKTYVFAMNGQTGKMTGTFPICKKRSTAWYFGIAAAAAAVAALVQLLIL